MADNSYSRRTAKKEERAFAIFKSGTDVSRGHDLSTSAMDDVPLLSVCVEGGPGSVDTVQKASAQEIPCLVVRGSGRAADLLADTVILKKLDHPDGLNVEQTELWDVLIDLVHLFFLHSTCASLYAQSSRWTCHSNVWVLYLSFRFSSFAFTFLKFVSFFCLSFLSYNRGFGALAILTTLSIAIAM